jgi:hypothetical protein
MAKANKSIPMGHLAELSLSSLELYHVASFSNSCHLAEYIIAFTAFHQRNGHSLIVSDSLKALYHTQGGWSGNEVVQIVQMVRGTLLRLISSRNFRIYKISNNLFIGTENRSSDSRRHAKRTNQHYHAK